MNPSEEFDFAVAILQYVERKAVDLVCRECAACKKLIQVSRFVPIPLCDHHRWDDLQSAF